MPYWNSYINWRICHFDEIIISNKYILQAGFLINTLMPGDVYMRQWTKLSLLCWLFYINPLPETMLAYCKYKIRFQWTFNQNRFGISSAKLWPCWIHPYYFKSIKTAKMNPCYPIHCSSSTSRKKHPMYWPLLRQCFIQIRNWILAQRETWLNKIWMIFDVFNRLWLTCNTIILWMCVSNCIYIY